MRDLVILFVHLISTLVRSLGPGGLRSVVAETLLVKHHLSILNRSRERAPNLRSGRRKPSGMIDVAVIQSLVRKGVVDDRVGDYGQLIVDECHHLPAHSFEQVPAGRSRDS